PSTPTLTPFPSPTLFRSLLPIISLPIAVTLSFIPMYLLDIPATIMSLGGIAIAIVATVDAEIVMIEACHKKLEHAPPDISKKDRDRKSTRLNSSHVKISY